MNRSMGMNNTSNFGNNNRGGNPNNTMMMMGNNGPQRGGGPMNGMMNNTMMMGGGGNNNNWGNNGGGGNNMMNGGGGGGNWGNTSQWGNNQQQPPPGLLGGCCQNTAQPGMPVDVFICGNEATPLANPLNPMEANCDCATMATLFFSVMSIVAFAVVMAVKEPDQIFEIYPDCTNTAELQMHMVNDVPYLLNLLNISNSRTDNLTRRVVTQRPSTTAAPIVTTKATIPTTTPAPTTTATTTAPTTPTEVVPPPILIKAGDDARYQSAVYTNKEQQQARGFVAMEETIYDTSINHLNVDPDPNWNQTCGVMKGLSGTFGKVCIEQSLNAAAFYFQLYNWTAFRNTLYFIAMVGSLITLLLVYAVHRHKNPAFGTPAYQQKMAMMGGVGGGGGGGNSMMPMNRSMNTTVGGPGGQPPQFGTEEPIHFSNTNFFVMFRAGWGMVSVVIFLWVATQMYSFWMMIGDYKELTTGPLHDFWRDYEKKFVGSVVCITLYLCWPLAHLCLEIGFFVAFFIPYYGFRSMCKQGVENVRYPIDTPLDVIPGWVRIDMFFTEFNQLKRLGFSVQMWHLMTGSYEPFFDMCADQMPNPNLEMRPNPLDGGESGMANGGGMMSSGGAGMNATMMMQNNTMMMGGGGRGSNNNNNDIPMSNRGSPQDNFGGNNNINNRSHSLAGGLPSADNGDMGLSPTKSSSKKDKTDKKEKSRDKSRERRKSDAAAVSATADNSMAFSPSENDGGDNDAGKSSTRRDKSEKKEKKDKHHSKSNRDKSDKTDKTDKKDKSKSKREKKERDDE